MMLAELRDKLVELQDDAKAIQANADTEKRDLTEDEDKQIRAYFSEFNSTREHIERLETLERQEQILAKPQTAAVEKPDPQATKMPMAPLNVELIERPGLKGRWGWQSMGDFAMAVKKASMPGTQPDNRLLMAPTTVGTEGVGSEGGYAVPPDFRAAIVSRLQGEDSLLARTDQLTSSSNSITVPVDETTAWQTTGGILSYWEGENDQISQSKPLLKSITLRLSKLAVLIPVTDELLDDAAALDSYLRRKAGEKLVFKVNDAIVNGDGVGKPLGVLNSSAEVSQAAEGSQTATTINYPNVVKMYSRMYAPYRSGAVWLINQDAENQLHTLAFPSASGTEPAWLPAGGISGRPFQTLFGRPIIPTQACQTLGTVGDIIFWAPQEYLTVTKGGIRSDVSIHLWFDYDTTAYRFIYRLAGQPWLSTTITPLNGSTTMSSIVSLATRS